MANTDELMRELNGLLNTIRPTRQRRLPQDIELIYLFILDYNEMTRRFLDNPQLSLHATQYNNVMLNFTEILKNRLLQRRQQRPATIDLVFDIPIPDQASSGLTEEQIQQNTTIVPFDSSMNEERCPISMENFIVGEEIYRINSCQHIFKKNELIGWFRQHSNCPVCRQSIVAQDTTTNQRERESVLSSPTLQNILRSIINPNESFSLDINDNES
jgi:hypothetical protein